MHFLLSEVLIHSHCCLLLRLLSLLLLSFIRHYSMGHDLTLFVQQPVDDAFLCGICLGVQDKPTSVCANGHTYCHDCVHELLRFGANKNLTTNATAKGAQCPECHLDVTTTTLSSKDALQFTIGSLQVHCPHSSDNGDNNNNKENVATLALANMGTQQQETVVKSKRPPSCSWRGPLSNYFESHLTKECEFATTNCGWCKAKVRVCDLANHTERQCPVHRGTKDCDHESSSGSLVAGRVIARASQEPNPHPEAISSAIGKKRKVLCESPGHGSMTLLQSLGLDRRVRNRQVQPSSKYRVLPVTNQYLHLQNTTGTTTSIAWQLERSHLTQLPRKPAQSSMTKVGPSRCYLELDATRIDKAIQIKICVILDGEHEAPIISNVSIRLQGGGHYTYCHQQPTFTPIVSHHHQVLEWDRTKRVDKTFVGSYFLTEETTPTTKKTAMIVGDPNNKDGRTLRLPLLVEIFGTGATSCDCVDITASFGLSFRNDE